MEASRPKTCVNLQTQVSHWPLSRTIVLVVCLTDDICKQKDTYNYENPKGKQTTMNTAKHCRISSEIPVPANETRASFSLVLFLSHLQAFSFFFLSKIEDERSTSPRNDTGSHSATTFSIHGLQNQLAITSCVGLFQPELFQLENET